MSSPNATTSTKLVVTRAATVADDVMCFELSSTDTSPLPAWSPGAHIDVILPSGLIRQYSLCGDPQARSTYRIAVLRETAGRGGSVEAHEALRPGAVVGIKGPRNHFPLLGADRYEFIAGGIGITPLLAMATSVSRAGIPWHLTYGGRRRSSMAFVDELSALPGGSLTIVPQDSDGHPDLERMMKGVTADTGIYCCGPAPLIAAAVACGSALNPLATVHFERFTAEPVQPHAPDEAIEVELARSGRRITVPAEKSILNALLDEGIETDSSCDDGICGTCEVKVLSGVPDHRDSVLTDDERAANDVMMICVGRARTPRLVLDL